MAETEGQTVRVVLPRALLTLFSNAPSNVDIHATTVGQLVDELNSRWPGMGDRLRDTSPAIRKHINVFVDGRRATLQTTLAPGAKVYILTAISGGQPETMKTRAAISKLENGLTILDGDWDAAAQIETELLGSLRTDLPQANNHSIILTIRDDGGDLIGGLTASTSYGWMLVKTLWVSDGARNKGLGQALMAQAEDKARALGCHGAWMDTSNPAAQRFYAGLGYQPFGQLENTPNHHPPSHRRWFMKKQLTE